MTEASRHASRESGPLQRLHLKAIGIYRRQMNDTAAFEMLVKSAGRPRAPRPPAPFWESPRLAPTLARRTSRQWTGLRAAYAWHPPFEGEAPTEPNRLEVVFSAHDDVILTQDGKQYELQVRPGSMYIVSDPATTLRRVREPSDTLEMYVDDRHFEAVAEAFDLGRPQYRPTLAAASQLALPHDPIALGLAHILRRACLGTLELSDVEASAIGSRLAELMLGPQASTTLTPRDGRERLDVSALSQIADYVEASLSSPITVPDLAAIAGLSVFHFTRAFRNTMGMPPHQFVIGRRLERAKLLLVNTHMIVQDIAWSLGFENLSHFRRKFHAQFGISPGQLRMSQ